MTNDEVWAQYKDYTRDVTEYSRKLGFAGAAICWFFKDANATFPAVILYALASLVIFFVFDVLQGVTGALLIKWWVRREELKNWRDHGTIQGEYNKPGWLDYPSFTFFLLKVAALMVAFLFIGWHIFKL